MEDEAMRKLKEEEEEEEKEKEYRRKLLKNIQMLATLVATATYAAAFNPPGGVWQDIHDATGQHLPGDPIMRYTHHGRYVAFFYCNAAAFAFSLAVVVLTLLVTAIPKIRRRIIEKRASFLVILMILMLFAMLALAAAYGAGACQDKLTLLWYCLLGPGPLAWFIGEIIMFIIRLLRGRGGSNTKDDDDDEEEEEEKEKEVAAATKKNDDEEKKIKEEKRFGKMMVPLSMFALTITYVAGLSTPGGFWDSAEGGHRPGDAILKDRLHGRTLRGFLLSNTLAFAASLYGAVLSIVMRDNKRLLVRSVSSLNIILVVFLLLGGLLIAYCIGSSRGSSSITSRILATVLSELTLGYGVLMVVFFMKKEPAGTGDNNRPTLTTDSKEKIRCGVRPSLPGKETWIRPYTWVAGKVSKLMGLDSGADDPNSSGADDLEQHRQDKLVQLMAGLAVAITYQAGLYPPGGLWPANADGHMAGDPILLTTYARRYRGFHYCNSVSFVASLLVMFLAEKKNLQKHHALEAAMLLDMLGLIGAYAIGSCRDQVSTLYVVGLAGAAMVYVVIHVSYFTLGEGDGKNGAPPCASDNNKGKGGAKKHKKMGDRFLLFAILVASITYQAGLTPPGGFLLKDDHQSGHLAGDPVLHYNYPRRYRTFVFCNSVSFMLSIVLILLLVNPKQYMPAIQSHALSVCSAVSYACLMGAFAAGSTQHMRRSLHIFGMAAVAFFVFLLLPLLVCLKEPLWVHLKRYYSVCLKPYNKDNPNTGATGAAPAPLPSCSSIEANKGPSGERGQEKDIEDMGLGHGQKEKQPRRTTPEKQKQEEEEKEEKEELRRSVHLLTLAILVASATYPAGLEPPGGSWQSSSHGHDAGNSMMHDNRRQRYITFFFSNTTSFLASIVLIHMLLPAMVSLRVTNKLHELYGRGIKGLVFLQCLGLLVAYAAGSSRRWKTSVITGALVFPVLLFVAVHIRLSTWRQKKRQEKQDAQRCRRPTCDYCSKMHQPV